MPDKVILITQGEMKISSDRDSVFATVLGSCISVCMYDSFSKIGGMNHFLLPDGYQASETPSLSYGVHAMEVLINGLIEAGAVKSRLEAKLFGGANIQARFGSIGTRNAQFALDFLRKEHIACVSSSLGGKSARRVRFWPVTGRAQQAFIEGGANPVVEIEAAESDMKRIQKNHSCDVELF